MVGTGGVNAVLIGDDLPDLRADLVTALTTLDCNLRTAGRIRGELGRQVGNVREKDGGAGRGRGPNIGALEGRAWVSAGLRKGARSNPCPGGEGRAAAAHKLTHRRTALISN